MRFIAFCIGLACLIAGISLARLPANPDQPTKWQAMVDTVRGYVSTVASRVTSALPIGRWAGPVVGSGAGSDRAATPPSPAGAAVAQGEPAGMSATLRDDPNLVTLHLRNGSLLTGVLVRKTRQQVVLRLDYGEVTFHPSEVARIVSGWQGTDASGMRIASRQPQDTWPYERDVVVKLMKGSVVDAAITQVTPETVLLTQALEGGGSIEHTIPREEIAELLFHPISNERSQQIRDSLLTIFPKMRWDEQGMITIVTDSIPPLAARYRQTVNELVTDWYLTFFPLVRERDPQVQQYVVIFDDWTSYMEYALTDGVPGWLAVGYFSPEDQVLYCFNMLSDWFSRLLYDVYLNPYRDFKGRVSDAVGDSRYSEVIKGRLAEVEKKLESYHAMLRQTFRRESEDTLRHELTHALFNNWKLQDIALSKMREEDEEEAKKKREFLESEDIEKKRALLEEMLSKVSATPVVDVQASNAWFVEGLAEYMGPSPLGGLNKDRLADAQQARREGLLLPLEFLDTFRLGSFSGMATDAMLRSYAQSWAFCHFLMHRYPQALMVYLDRMARERAAETEDDLAWLLEATGKDLRALEGEFLAYLDALPPQDPPYLEDKKRRVDLGRELDTLWQQLW